MMRPNDFLDIEFLREQLALAENRVALSEDRVVKQKAVVQQLRSLGQDAGAAEALLSELERVLQRRTETRDRVKMRLARQTGAS